MMMMMMMMIFGIDENVVGVVCSVGLRGGQTAFVVRRCERGLRRARCLPEIYGGTVECYCQTDFCNDGGSVPPRRTTSSAPVSATDLDLAMLVTVCLVCLLLTTLQSKTTYWQHQYNSVTSVSGKI